MGNLYHIWSEGFRATGENGTAHYHGKMTGNTFQEACESYANENENFKPYFNAESLTFWGCKLFDNELDARRSFG